MSLQFLKNCPYLVNIEYSNLFHVFTYSKGYQILLHQILLGMVYILTGIASGI